MEWLHGQIFALNDDVEIFSAIVDPVNFLGAMRDTTAQEIVELLSWAKGELGFDEAKARQDIAADMEELRRECDATARELSTDDQASAP